MRLSSELEPPVVLDRLFSSDGSQLPLRRRCKLAKHVITGKTHAGAVDEYWNDG
jgi:7-keto-8-aminopelargonate synthetase-like enzyme